MYEFVYICHVCNTRRPATKPFNQPVYGVDEAGEGERDRGRGGNRDERDNDSSTTTTNSLPHRILSGRRERDDSLFSQLVVLKLET